MALFKSCLSMHIGVRPINQIRIMRLFQFGQLRTYSRLFAKTLTSTTTPKPKVFRTFCLCGLPSAVFPLFIKIAQCKTVKNRVSESSLYRENVESGAVADGASEERIPWRELWHLLLPYIHYLLGATATAILAAIVNIQLPLQLGVLINIVAGLQSNPASMGALYPVALKLLALYAVQSVLTFVYISLVSVLGEHMASSLRIKLFHSLITQDVAFFDTHRTGELVARLSGDVQEFKSAFKQCVSQGLKSITQTIGCVTSLYIISPQMTYITVAALPAIVICGTFLGSFLRVLSRKAQMQIAVATAIADEALSNIRTVRAFAMEETEQSMYNKEVDKTKALNEILGIGIGGFQGVTNFALNGIVLAVVYGGSQLILSGDLNPGNLMSYLVTTQVIQRSLAQLTLLFGTAVKGLSAGARVFEYIHLQPSMSVAGGQIIPYHSLVGEVRFENVAFSYPSRPDHKVLEDFSLVLPPGRVVALCGLSGSGKSTIAALLERFYDADSGCITIDGQDIRKLDPKWMRGRAIGFISQEPVLFHTTIKENIRYGKPDATELEIIDAAKVANADSFIRSFPRGYNTVVGERGVTLSGGQKQRIAIARAILKNPTILILDEATSALDAESERLVQDALDKAEQGRTVLVIAHRLSTVQKADLIAVIANKRIAEVGDHKSLMKRQGIYWKLIQYQQQR